MVNSCRSIQEMDKPDSSPNSAITQTTKQQLKVNMFGWKLSVFVSDFTLRQWGEICEEHTVPLPRCHGINDVTKLRVNDGLTESPS